MSLARQGTWMVFCTTVAGVFMFGVHAFAPALGAASYSALFLLVSLINLANIPAPGIQTVFAYETARTTSDADRQRLAGNLLGVLAFLTIVWCLFTGTFLLGKEWILSKLKLSDDRALWVTWLAILFYLWLPVLMGVMQGQQRFGRLGWAVLCNGSGRFLGFAVMLVLLGPSLHSLMWGPCLGVLGAVLLCGLTCRELFVVGCRQMAWRRWLWRAFPFALGPGIFQFMLTIDFMLARVQFDEVESGYYGAARLAGFGLVVFVGPLAGVMFPKLVRETSSHRGARLVRDTALATTIVVGIVAILAGVTSFLLPSIIQWIGGALWIPEGWRLGLAAKEQQLLWIGGAAPWFSVAMGPLAVANVYISHLVAREQFRRIVYLLGVPLIYGIGLLSLSWSVKSLILWVGIGNCGLLACAYILSQKLWMNTNR